MIQEKERKKKKDPTVTSDFLDSKSNTKPGSPLPLKIDTARHHHSYSNRFPSHIAKHDSDSTENAYPRPELST
jgi:hypothetical protein